MFLLVFLYVSCLLVDSLPQNINENYNDLSSQILDPTNPPFTEESISLAPACDQSTPTPSTKDYKLAFDDSPPPSGFPDCPAGKHHHCCRKGNTKMCTKWDEDDEWCSGLTSIYCCREVRGTLGFDCEPSVARHSLPAQPEWLDDLYDLFARPAKDSCPANGLNPEY